jgi:hypothetical protein
MSAAIDPNDVIAAITRLRADEGSWISIVCDNPEADSSDRRAAIDIFSYVTYWNKRRFYGPTWQQCVIDADRWCVEQPEGKGRYGKDKRSS